MSVNSDITQRKGQGIKEAMHSGSPGRRVKMKSYAQTDKASSSGRNKREKMQEDLDILLEKGILGSDFSWSALDVKGKPFEENPGESESDDDIPAECVCEEESDIQEVNGEVGWRVRGGSHHLLFAGGLRLSAAQPNPRDGAGANHPAGPGSPGVDGVRTGIERQAVAGPGA